MTTTLVRDGSRGTSPRDADGRSVATHWRPAPPEPGQRALRSVPTLPVASAMRRTAILLAGIAATWRRAWRDVGAHEGVGKWLMRLLRPLRVLAFTRAHLRLLTLPVYQEFGITLFGNDPFHHLSNRHYLRRGLSVRQRIQYVHDHYTVESRHWRQSYRHAVYGGTGLELWRQESQGSTFTIKLEGSSSVRGSLYEGELKLALWVDDLPLHQMNVSLVTEPTLGSVVPFVGRSQGCANWHPEARSAFERSFPQNSAMFFCFAAVSGVARLIGAPGVIGVRGHEQVCADPDEAARFHRNYDGFWQALGGTDDGGLGTFIPLPDYDKPVENSSASHRKRARKRRKHWADIDAAAVQALEPHLSEAA